MVRAGMLSYRKYTTTPACLSLRQSRARQRYHRATTPACLGLRSMGAAASRSRWNACDSGWQNARRVVLWASIDVHNTTRRA